MQLNLTDAQLQQVVTAAVLAAISGPDRDKLLGDAIAGLLKERAYPGMSYDQRTRLQVAFGDAVQVIAKEQVRAAFSDDARTRKMLNDILREAIERAFVQEREKLVERVALTIGAALSKIDQ
ncbi:MAG: hypothetical protein PVSMB8_00800 [Vulcanimicrobiaceae bacterium]